MLSSCYDPAMMHGTCQDSGCIVPRSCIAGAPSCCHAFSKVDPLVRARIRNHAKFSYTIYYRRYSVDHILGSLGLYYTIRYHIKLYYTIPYDTILYYTIPCYTILFCTILYYTILYYTILYYTILYYTILYYTILYYTILYYTILYYILYYTILY